MTVQYSTAVRNAMGDAWETAMGTSAKARIYSGSMPANCGTARSGTLLAEWAMASDWSAAASAGAKTLSSLPLSTTGAAAGTAGYYSIMDSAGTTCHEQGTVTATGGGGDMTIDNTSIAASQTVQITGFTKTWPGA
jgi:hypothetical protein